MEWDLEIDKVVKEIKKNRARLVCLHLPDGLKAKADLLEKKIREKVKVDLFFWFGSNFGSCDFPRIEGEGFDLLISFGHSKWI